MNLGNQLDYRKAVERKQFGPLQAKIRDLDESEIEELELATDEALGRVEPK